MDSNFWKKYFKVYDHLNLLIPYQELLNEVIQISNISPGQKVLDAGAGTGNFCTKINHNKTEIYAIDSSIDALFYLKQKNSSITTKIHNLGNELPFNNNFFDIITCINTLYLIDRKKINFIMKEFHRVLKNNGILIIVNPMKESKPYSIFIEHIKKSIKKVGFCSTFFQLLVYSIVIIKFFYYNGLIIKKLQNNIIYGFVTKDHQETIFKKNGFSFPKSILGYAENAVITFGRK